MYDELFSRNKYYIIIVIKRNPQSVAPLAEFNFANKKYIHV